MKKTGIFLALILAVCFACVFCFTACGNNDKSDDGSEEISNSASAEQIDSTDSPRVEEWSFTADNAEDAKEIFDSFFYLTIYEENMIVTVTNSDEVCLKETIADEKDHIVYSEDYDAFCYKDGDDYIYAVRDGNNKYYFVDEEKYDENSFAFIFYLNILEDLPEGCTVSLTSEGTSTYVGYDIIIDATLTLDIDYGDTVLHLIAEKESDKVVSCKSAYTNDDGSSTIEVTFEFGNASVELPDINDWFNASAPKEESEWYVTGKVGGEDHESIPMYFDWQTGCYVTDLFDITLGDSFTVKNKNDATVSYSQSVDEDFLAGYQKIVFDPEQESVAFESEEDPSDPDLPTDPDDYEVWTVVGKFDGVDMWEDDKIMGLREDGTYASDTIELHNGDELKVRKDRQWGEEYPIGLDNNYVVNIEKTANYFVIFNPETHEITLEYDTMENLNPSEIDWSQYIPQGGEEDSN